MDPKTMLINYQPEVEILILPIIISVSESRNTTEY